MVETLGRLIGKWGIHDRASCLSKRNFMPHIANEFGHFGQGNLSQLSLSVQLIGIQGTIGSTARTLAPYDDMMRLLAFAQRRDPRHCNTSITFRDLARDKLTVQLRIVAIHQH